MAVFNEPTQWTHTLGNAADVSTLPDDTGASTGLASLQKLWQQVNQLPLNAGGVAPARTDFNALFKLLGDSVFYAMQGGVASYNASYDYPRGALVKYNDSIYFCVQANGAESTIVAPDSNRAYWWQVASSDPWAQFPTGFHMGWLSKDPIPDNWLIMNGQSVSKSTYADLNVFINSDGSLDDSGDSSKFIIPDMTGRVWQGGSAYSDVLVAKEAGLPNINGDIANFATGQADPARGGAFTTSSAVDAGGQFSINFSASPHQSWSYVKFSASDSNSIYKQGGNLQPKALQALMIIRA